MALGEHWTHWPETEHLLLVKVGTGIGCGIVADGHIHRGAQGAAGDIGHVRVDRRTTTSSAAAATSAASRRSRAARRSRAGSRDEGDERDAQPRRRPARPGRRPRARSGWCATPAARSARCWPAPSTSSTPAVIVIGGDIAEAHAELLAGVREGDLQPLAAARDARPADRPLPARRPGRRHRRGDHGDRARARARRRRSRPRRRGLGRSYHSTTGLTSTAPPIAAVGIRDASSIAASRSSASKTR